MSAGEVNPAVSTSRSTFGIAFSTRHNSLNFLRLVFAVIVIVSHAFIAGGFKPLDDIHGVASGTLAVFGFFAISGYLIARSADRNNAGRYLWQRFLRIFPAFWACLLMTAFVFGPIAWWSVPHSCGSISCYLRAPSGPLDYIWRNFLLHMNQESISGTPTGKTHPLPWTSWNGSLWTLFYEFLCYLLILGLAVIGFLRVKSATLAVGIGAFILSVWCTAESKSLADFNVFHNWVWMNLLKFAVVFLAGTLIYLYRDHIPDSGWIAMTCGGLVLASLYLPDGKAVPGFDFAYSTLFLPLLAYPVLWLGAHLPFRSIGAKNDYSYGVYIYAFPVQQLCAVWAFQRWGYIPYLALVILGTVPLAMGSWWAIERHALKLKSLFKMPSPAALRGLPAAEEGAV